MGYFGTNRQPPQMGKRTQSLFYPEAYQPGAADTFLMIPRTPIMGIHYIEATQSWIDGQWGLVWDNYVKKVEYTVPTIRLTKAVSKGSSSNVLSGGNTASDEMKLSLQFHSKGKVRLQIN